MQAPRIAIIGGGPGGLLTAYLLQSRTRRELDVSIFESSKRLGGKVRTGQFSAAPVLYEAGAAELYDYSGVGPDPLRELITAFGLPTRPMEGKTVVMGDAILTTDEDIRRHLGPKTLLALKDFTRRATALVSPAEYYESDWKEDNADPLSRKKLSELLASIPDEAARKYVRIAIHSDLATEPHLTNAMYGLQNYLMNEPGYMRLYTIDGGIERFIRELIARLGPSTVRLERRVSSVERTSDETYLVTSRHHGEWTTDEYDYVVAALPNNWLPAVDWRGKALAKAMHAHHVHYDYPAHYLRVSLLFEKPFWRDRIAGSYFMIDGLEGCCVYDESSRHDGCTFGVLGWLIAGEAALSLCNLDDDALIERVLDSLPRLLAHGRGLLLEGRVHRWAGSVNGLPAGYPAREPDSRHVPDPVGHPELFVVGDYLFDSTLNGVMDSADTVAEWVLEEVEDEAMTVDGSGVIDLAAARIDGILSASADVEMAGTLPSGRAEAATQSPTTP